MPKLILKTPEEYNTVPVLVDGTSYEDATLSTPQTHVSEISKTTMLQLEQGLDWESKETDLTEITERIVDLEEWRINHEEEYLELKEMIDGLPDFDEFSTKMSSLENTVSEISAAIEALNREIALLKDRVSALECPCGCMAPPTPAPDTNCQCGC